MFPLCECDNALDPVPATLVGWITEAQLPAWLLLGINVLLLLIGSVLDPLSAILLLMPLLVPLDRGGRH